MIPVLTVSVIRPDFIHRMLASVDVPVERTLIVDNGAGIPDIDGVWVVHLPRNIPVAAAGNLMLKLTPDAAWWASTSDDLVFAPGDLTRLTEVMEAHPEPYIATLDGFAASGMNAAAHHALGYVDENFVPAYCEDCDWEYRAKLAGVPIVAIPANLRHERSSTIALPMYGRQNDRTYGENVTYFTRKWGGSMRGGEVYRTPFDRGGHPNDWALDPKRLRDLSWKTPELWPEREFETTMILPAGETR